MIIKWTYVFFISLCAVYTAPAQAAEHYTIHVSGQTKQCYISNPGNCWNQINAVWLYFDRKGRVFVYDDVNSGVILERGQRSNGYMHKKDKLYTAVNYHESGNNKTVSVTITSKDPQNQFNKSMKWTYRYSLQDGGNCKLTGYQARSNLGLRFSSPRGKFCKFYAGRRNPVF